MKNAEQINLPRRRFLQAAGFGTAALALPMATLGALQRRPEPTSAPAPSEDLAKRYRDDARWAGCCDLPVIGMGHAVSPVGYFGMV